MFFFLLFCLITPPIQRHTDIFDLVSGVQQEAIKEEELVREKREKKVAKERQKRREWAKEVDRGKEKDDEVSRRRARNDFECRHQRSRIDMQLFSEVRLDLKYAEEQSWSSAHTHTQPTFPSRRQQGL